MCCLAGARGARPTRDRRVRLEKARRQRLNGRARPPRARRWRLEERELACHRQHARHGEAHSGEGGQGARARGCEKPLGERSRRDHARRRRGASGALDEANQQPCVLRRVTIAAVTRTAAAVAISAAAATTAAPPHVCVIVCVTLVYMASTAPSCAACRRRRCTASAATSVKTSRGSCSDGLCLHARVQTLRDGTDRLRRWWPAGTSVQRRRQEREQVAL